MKKFLLSLFLIGTTTLVVGVVSGYIYGRSHLGELPDLLARSLQKQGVLLKYGSADIPSSGLSLSFGKVSVEGQALPIRVTAERLTLSLELGWSWPLLKLSAAAVRPTVEKNPDVRPIPAAGGAALDESTAKIASYALGLSQLQVSVADLSYPELQLSGLNAMVALRHLALGTRGLVRGELSHDLLVGECGRYPWLAGMHWKGDSTYEAGAIESRDQSLALGPVVLQLDGRYDFQSQKWTVEAQIPKTSLSQGTSILNAQAQWLKSVTGEIEVKLTAQGLGADPKALNADGKLLARSLKMKVDHPDARGDVLADIDAEFSKAQTLAVRVNTSVDLTAAGLEYQKSFLKPRGVPCTFSVNLDGKDGRFTLSKGEGKFNNLALALSGELSFGPDLQGPPKANLKASIAPTSLEGWEQFFPRFASLKTQGTLEGQVSYLGPLEDWKSSEIDARLKAQNLRVPVLKSWVPVHGLEIEGIADIQSDTALTYLRGTLKQLSTETRVDLARTLVTYGNFFQKSPKTPLSADLSVVSNGSRAEIRRGEIVAGSLRGHLKGSVENFLRPSLQVSFNTERLEIPQILALSPAAKVKTMSQLSGAFSARGEVVGPLVPGPEVRGQLDLFHVAGTYTGEDGAKPVRLSDATGSLAFGHDSLSARKLALRFAHSDGQLDLDLRSFQHPDLKFTLKGGQFTLADFTTPPAAGSGAPVGVVTVPVKGGTSAAKEDFRRDPYVKDMRVDGSIAFRQVDFGWAKGDTFSAHLGYDKLWLKIDPLTVNIMGGKLSTATEWDGRSEVPRTKLTIRAEKVDANQFLSECTEKIRDTIFGKLSSTIALQFQGLTAEAVKQSVTGNGSYSLTDGVIKPLKLVQKPIESLRKLPLIGSSIGQPSLDEKLSTATGSFRLEKGKIFLSDLILRNPYMDAIGHDATLDYDQNLSAKLEWFPKPTLVPARYIDGFRDGSGKASLPLLVGGTLQSPSVTLDQGVVEARLKAYALRKAEAEKTRVVNQVRSQVQDRLQQEAQKQLGGLKNIFK